MKIIHGIKNLSKTEQNQIIALGFFDGIHKGHQALIREAERISLTFPDSPSILVYTFNKHPLEIINPEKAPFLLTTLEEKIEMLEKLQVDLLLIGEFNETIANLSPKDFLKKIVCEQLKARQVITGFNYRYGKGHKGNVETLVKDGESLGFPVSVVSAIVLDGEPVSSTRIRNLISSGSVEEAARLLGRNYSLTGIVTQGEGRGRNLGFPTANLHINYRKLLPKIGIYAGTAKIKEETPESNTYKNQEWMVAISIGKRPTFNGKQIVVEAHLLNYSGNLYGKKIEVELFKRIRDEEKFSSPEALTKKMEEDVALVRDFLGLHDSEKRC
jgi:riboflavin kinase/FMN adenylyltransferase